MSRLFGRRTTKTARAEEPGDAWLAEVAATFAPVGEREPDRLRAIVAYVDDGSDQPWRKTHFQHAEPTIVPARLVAAIEASSAATTLQLARFLEVLHGVSLKRNGYGTHPMLRPIPWVASFASTRVWDLRSSSATIPLDLARVEQILVATGHPGSLAVQAAFVASPPGQVDWHSHTRKALRRLVGFDAAVARHAGVIRAGLVDATVEDRLAALESLAVVADETLALFADELAECLTATSTKVARAAADLAPRVAPALVTPLRRIASEGKPPARLKALQALHRTGDADTRAWAEQAAEVDRAAGVRALPAVWRAEAAPQDAATTDPELPPKPVIDWRTDVPPATRKQLRELIEEVNRLIGAEDARMRAWRQQHGGGYGRGDAPPIPLDAFDAGLDALAAGRAPEPGPVAHHASHHHLLHGLRDSDALVALGFPAAIGLLASVGGVATHREPLLPAVAASVLDRLQVDGRPVTPLEIAAALDELGIDGGGAVLLSWAHHWNEGFGDGWTPADLEPFLLTHLDKVIDLLRRTDDDSWVWVDDQAPYRALAMLSRLPRAAVEALFELSLGSRKASRRPAQDLLAGVPGIDERVIAALADGRAEVRAEAAAWLARTRPQAALPALEEAVAKERQDLAKGAMLDALQALGQPVEKYLDRTALGRDAQKLVAKGLPAALSWFPWSGLPPVRWADTGEQVETVVLQWMLAQGVRAKSARPNAVLRKYCAMFEPADREAFGQFVLEAWIAQDLMPHSPAEAEERARQDARHYAGYFNQTEAEYVARYLPYLLRQPVGSATASKGVLAVAAACAGGGAAPVASAYLKEWYGHRPSQGRALIEMLAWIDHPSATQLVLSVGSRFRTKSFQEEATRQAQALAERKGWTMAELADRTIPTAGFEEDGVLELSYGDRVFTARLRADLTVELSSPEGKVIKALPPPRQTDDADAVKAAKRRFTAAKKELKDVVSQQGDRLYEALCTGRTWAADLWSTYLDGHPVGRLLTPRVVWTATAPDGTVTLFRPLGDGSLTDAHDEPVELGADDVVGIAHDSLTTSEEAAAWVEHLADYEVTPLFGQFGKDRYELSEERRRDKAVKDFEGHLVEAFKLRGRANKLGYTRGAAEDGGVFVTYEKRFTSLGLAAVIEFSGNTLPEENRVVALHELRFDRIGGRGRGGQAMLGDVPPILLSEAYADLRAVAAAGTGFDPEWQKKVEW